MPTNRLLRLALLAAVIVLPLAILSIAQRGLAQPPARPVRQDAPDVYLSPINGGCYIAAPNDCRLHVDPFTINMATSSTLKRFQLQANSRSIYDFRTDTANPPASPSYQPSLVQNDFAATCGKAYNLILLGADSKDSLQWQTLGQTGVFTCPVSIP